MAIPRLDATLPPTLMIIIGTRGDRAALRAAERSLVRHAPLFDRVVLLADAHRGDAPITHTAQIGGMELLGAAECARRAYSLTPDAFLESLVPDALRYYMARGYEIVIGLPRGAFVRGPLDPLLDVLAGHDVEPDPAFEIGWWGRRGGTARRTVRRHPLDEEIAVIDHATAATRVIVVPAGGAHTLVERYRGTPLAWLVRAYQESLGEPGDEPRLPYRFGSFSNGIPVDSITRALLRNALVSGERFGDPGDVRADPSFFEWLSAAPNGGQGLSRYLARYVDLHAGLRRRFGRDARAGDVLAHLRATHPPDVPGAWFAGDGELGDPPPLEGTAGINVVGLFRAELGIGESGRAFARAIRAAGEPVALIDFSTATGSHRYGDSTIRQFATRPAYPVSLVCANPPEYDAFHAHAAGSAFARGRYRIGAWWWELQDLPKSWVRAFDELDELWAGSSFIYDTLAARAITSSGRYLTVTHIPPIVEARPTGPVRREDFGLKTDELVFLFMFDYMSVWERKNPSAAVEAFRIAFGGDEKVRLVIKTMNADVVPESAARLAEIVDLDPRITLTDRYLDRDGVARLIRACDVYVSLHRSEGFGLTIAESMAYGKPVVATNWSGNVDFVTHQNSYPVAFRLEPLARDYGPYMRGSLWAEPDVEHAAYQLRSIYEDPHAAARRASRGRFDIQVRFSVARVAALVRRRLDEIRYMLPRSVA